MQRSPHNLLAFALLCLVLVTSSAFAQSGYSDFYCTAGLHPDGYIDFSGLPPAPNFPNCCGSSSSAVTATLPVQGVPGLTVSITIPPLQSVFTAGPAYTITGGTLQLNGTIDSGAITLKFSRPITGLGLIATTTGKFDNGFTLTSGPPGASLANFATSVVNYTDQIFNSGKPLTMVDLNNGFREASLSLLLNSVEGSTATLSNFRVQSAIDSSPSRNVSRNGLQQWLRSEDINTDPYAGSGSWPDQSGLSHDATQTISANQPFGITSDGQTCHASYAFSGKAFFNFNLPINGWQKMTVFLVSKSQLDPPASSYASEASAILWTENAYWGNTFVTPYQTSAPFRFGTTQTGNQPIYKRPLTVGQDFTLTRAVHNGTTDSLYINSIKVLSQGNKYPVLSGTTGAGTIGKGINNTYFNGEISEILVYNRVLSGDETALIESYLRNKYGLH